MNIPTEQARKARIPRPVCEQQLVHSDIPHPPTTRELQLPPDFCTECSVAKLVCEESGRTPFACNDLPRAIKPAPIPAKAAHNTKTWNTNPYNPNFNHLGKTHNCSGITIMAPKPKATTEVMKRVARRNQNKHPNRWRRREKQTASTLRVLGIWNLGLPIYTPYRMYFT